MSRAKRLALERVTKDIDEAREQVAIARAKLSKALELLSREESEDNGH